MIRCRKGRSFYLKCEEYLQGQRGFVKALKRAGNGRARNEQTQETESLPKSGDRLHLQSSRTHTDASINKYIVQGSLLNPLLDIIIGIFDCPMFVLHKMRHITKLSVCMTVISGFLLFGDTKKYTSRLQDHR